MKKDFDRDLTFQEKVLSLLSVSLNDNSVGKRNADDLKSEIAKLTEEIMKKFGEKTYTRSKDPHMLRKGTLRFLEKEIRRYSEMYMEYVEGAKKAREQLRHYKDAYVGEYGIEELRELEKKIESSISEVNYENFTIADAAYHFMTSNGIHEMHVKNIWMEISSRGKKLKSTNKRPDISVTMVLNGDKRFEKIKGKKGTYALKI